MKVPHASVIFGFCMASAFVCAFAFAVVFQLTLPSTDAAYPVTLAHVFDDTLVNVSAIIGAVAFGIFSFPFVFFALRKTRPAISAPVILSTVLLEILLATPFIGYGAIAGALLVLVGVCVYFATRKDSRSG